MARDTLTGDALIVSPRLIRAMDEYERRRRASPHRPVALSPANRAAMLRLFPECGVMPEQLRREAVSWFTAAPAKPPALGPLERP